MARPQFEVKETYTGTGLLSAYTFRFKIETSEQLLLVIVDDEGVEVERFRGNDNVLISNIVFNSVVGEGTVTLATNLPLNYKLVLLLANDLPTQKYEFNNKQSFDLKKLEMALDFLGGPIQRQAYLAKQSFRIHDLDDENDFNAQFPPGVEDAKDRTLTISPDGKGVVFGPTATEVGNAQAAAQAAIQAAADAAVSEENAKESEENAAASEEATIFWTNLFLFDNYEKVDDTVSPVNVLGTDDSTLYLSNDENGPIVFNLPFLSAVDETWKVAVIKNSDSVNALTINAQSGETIKGNPTFTTDQRGIGVVFYKESETNWGTKFFAFTESTGMSSLPPGGSIGAALVKRTAVDGDAEWDDLNISGFSNRLNQEWNSLGLRDFIIKFLDIVYAGPLIASFTGTSNTLREKGTVVSAITLNVNVTKRTNNIGRILFTQGATTIVDMNPPANVGSGVSSANYSTPFSDTITFTVAVTDETTVEGGPTTVSANVTYNFVYPYYYGAAAPGRTPAQVAALTKDVINSNANLTRNFTTINGDVYYFAYPASYGALTSIKDANGFEVLSSFTRRTENITGLNGTPVSYYIYEANNPQVAGTTSFNFIR